MEEVDFHGWTDSEVLNAQNMYQHLFELHSWNPNEGREKSPVKVT